MEVKIDEAAAACSQAAKMPSGGAPMGSWQPSMQQSSELFRHLHLPGLHNAAAAGYLHVLDKDCVSQRDCAATSPQVDQDRRCPKSQRFWRVLCAAVALSACSRPPLAASILRSTSLELMRRTMPTESGFSTCRVRPLQEPPRRGYRVLHSFSGRSLGRPAAPAL